MSLDAVVGLQWQPISSVSWPTWNVRVSNRRRSRIREPHLRGAPKTIDSPPARHTEWRYDVAVGKSSSLFSEKPFRSQTPASFVRTRSRSGEIGSRSHRGSGPSGPGTSAGAPSVGWGPQDGWGSAFGCGSQGRDNHRHDARGRRSPRSSRTQIHVPFLQRLTATQRLAAASRSQTECREQSNSCRKTQPNTRRRICSTVSRCATGSYQPPCDGSLACFARWSRSQCRGASVGWSRMRGGAGSLRRCDSRRISPSSCSAMTYVTGGRQMQRANGSTPRTFAPSKRLHGLKPAQSEKQSAGSPLGMPAHVQPVANELLSFLSTFTMEPIHCRMEPIG